MSRPSTTAATSTGEWPEVLPAVQVRMARPTGRLEAVTAFYRDLLGLPELHRSRGDGWTVVMLGLPGDRYHLELVAHDDGIDGTAPTGENLLVLYFDSARQRDTVATRLRDGGAPEVHLDNPWWARHGAVAFSDPDRWRVVLMPHPVPLLPATEPPAGAGAPPAAS
jgi:catechol 2,3-dioxygenase-like lactoylglutathione lyase family enzyme